MDINILMQSSSSHQTIWHRLSGGKHPWRPPTDCCREDRPMSPERSRINLPIPDPSTLVSPRTMRLETTEFLKAHIDAFGSPAANNHYSVGWAHATCTPYQWTKQVASHFGRTPNGMLAHWPDGFIARGETGPSSTT